MSESTKKDDHLILEKLSLTEIDLCAILNEIESLYYIFPISKGGKKKRWISAPRKKLKDLHKKLLYEVLYQVRVHDCAHGFVPQRSIVTNARPHLKQQWIANFDIHSFFPSTKETAVRAVFHRYFDLSKARAEQLVGLCTRNGELPQGAPTSPCLANLVMYDADCLLHTYATENHLIYTRYADDLTLSGNTIPTSIHKDIQDILTPFHYQLAHHKSKILGQHKRQMVTGLVVNEKLNLPRPLRKQLRAIIHDVGQNGLEHALSRSNFNMEQIIGRISLQAMWNRDTAQQQILELAQALNLV